MQKTCSTDRIVQFPVIRVLACCAVVVLHTVFAANEYFIETLTPAENLFSRMVENNVMWAVPLFLMVTGALQLRSDKQLTWRKLYGKYIARVFFVLAVFSLIFRLFDIVMDGEALSAVNLLGGAATELITGKGWGHLWYLYLLIGLYILLPFYRLAAQKCSDTELKYLLAVYLTFTSVIPMIEGFGINIDFYISESLIYPFYLFVGYMLHEGRISISNVKACCMVAAATVIILALDVLKYSRGLDVPGVLFGYSSLLIVMQAVGIFALTEGLIASKKTDSRLVRTALAFDKYTFGVYLISMLFVRLFFKYLQLNPYDTGIVPALITLTGSVICILTLSCMVTALLKMIPGFRRIL